MTSDLSMCVYVCVCCVNIQIGYFFKKIGYLDILIGISNLPVKGVFLKIVFIVIVK